GELGYNTWGKNNYKNEDVGAANNWAGMAIDRDRELLFVPTGSAGYDFYGGNRPGQNLFANCLLALDANTGKRRWHFQFVHHDVWDRDLPSAPTLVKVKRNGREIDAVAQITKSGFVFVFDRETGKSLFPMKEIAVPTNGVAGEKPWPTQPVPLKPAPFARQNMTEADINPFAENKDELLATLKSIRHRNQFEMPSKQGTLIFPGYDGGGEWGGAGYDPETNLLYVNSNEMPWIMTLVDKPKTDKLAQLPAGERAYVQYCTACHSPDRKGNAKSGYPSLVDIGTRQPKDYVQNIVKNGKGMMPGFSYLSETERSALLTYLYGEEKKEVSGGAVVEKFPSVPYKTTGYNKFLDKNGYPAVNPPWGQLSAINLNTGEYAWKIPLGELKELTAKGIPPTGCENYGGPVVTAGGLLFIAATKDGMFRAFDKKTGKLLWETKLPAAGFATPATYQANGKQYVVIACGGTKLGTP
ncbi:MAG: pyrroloquinoline quinone-dependent dehydrogenase, partial [Runella slithyformis]